MTKAIENSIYTKPITNLNYIYPEGEFLYYIIQGSLIETATTYFTIPYNQEPNYLLISMAFIPMSFVFEIVFDFFFYWIHRFFHTSYISSHKKHHEHIHLKPVLTFYQDSFDQIFSVSLPFLLTEHLIQTVYPLSSFEIALLVNYKIFIEISGHSGRNLEPSSCFPQCIWLVKFLNIELYSEEHVLHHTKFQYNFSKRFTLWDKLFGTYLPRISEN